ncbi:MAG: MBL fold metallo-hydrolase [Rhodocyclaceae bacterium]
MAVELYNDGSHVCVGFYDLVESGGDAAVQCNQFLVIDSGRAALIDPGGGLSYNSLLLALQKHVALKDLMYILSSHADPDVIASVNKWFVASQCKVLISRLWVRFLPHFTTGRVDADRIVAIPDDGAVIPFGSGTIIALPAHFLHSEGNFQFYDPVSKILFSGDLGASLVSPEVAGEPVSDFDAHLRYMLGFHRRYMGSNKVCRLWANMVRQLDIQAIVPQHGSRFVGREMVGRFIDWVESLNCGMDLLTQDAFRVPAAR